MINTDFKQKEMQTSCQQRTKSLKSIEKMTPSASLIIPSKWTSCWMTNERKFTVFKFNCTGAGYSEEAPCILGIYDSLLVLVALISLWIQNFWRTAGLTSVLSMIKTLNKAILADFSRSVTNRMQSEVTTNKIHQNTLVNRMRLFFSLRTQPTLFIKIFRKRFKAKSYISFA